MRTLLALSFGTAYATWLSTEEGKAWIDENTTLGVVVGVGTVLGLTRFAVDGTSCGKLVGTFGAAEAPLVVCGVLRTLGERRSALPG